MDGKVPFFFTRIRILKVPLSPDYLADPFEFSTPSNPVGVVHAPLALYPFSLLSHGSEGDLGYV